MNGFTKWVIRTGLKLLQKILKNERYRKGFVKVANAEIDIEGLNEKEEAELFDTLYRSFCKIGLNFIEEIK
jgi:hypothetical protein